MSFNVRRLREDAPRKKVRLWKPIALALIGISGSLFGFYEHERERYKEHKASAHRCTILKRILLVLIAVLCALLLLAGTVKALSALKILNLGTITKLTGTAPPQDEWGHTNILLLGQGDEGHDGVNLTDTIMVASIDPDETKSIVLLSLPRDLYLLKTEKMGAGRINTMYRDYRSYLQFQKGMEEEEATQEAMRELAAEIGRHMGIQIHHTAKVDFIGFVKAVDLLEGIDVDVPYDIVDTEYPDENYGFETFQILAGPQHLDGETALKYARSRHTTSDFGRSARQQQILTAMGEKAKSIGIQKDPKKLIELLRILSANFETTMSISEAVGLAEIARDIERSRIITMQLNDRNGLYGGLAEPGGFLYNPPRDLFEGASVLLPVSIPEFPVTWKQIQTAVQLLMHHREVYGTQPEFAVLNSTARPGTARRLGNELLRYGFSVGKVENAESTDQATTTISYNNEADAALAGFFSLLLDIPVAPLPVDLPASQRTRLTIILGTDYEFTPLQDLLQNLQ
ncbi:MAG: LCP family protein [Candidatus Peribacteraceae bacterium]|nr:LCP family protein [Candidatus Peribacteraceae bacterium]